MADGSAVATVTGKTGPGLTATSLTFADVKSVFFDVVRRVVTIRFGSIGRFELDYAGTVTVTDTISGTVSTFVLST